MRFVRGLALALLCGGLAACHPLSCTHPADWPTDAPRETQARGAWPRDEVEIVIGEFGVPHIYASSEPDLAYGIGLMHARDRLFQFILLRAAALGRLTEIFGADLLSADQELRLLSHRLDEQLAATSPTSLDLLSAYCAGVNAGAADVGKSAEMHILGVDFAPCTPRDVLAVARLQAWDLSAGMTEELARGRIAARIPATDPRFPWLTGAAPSGGFPVVAPSEHSGTREEVQARMPAPSPAVAEPAPAPGLLRRAPPPARTPRARAILQALGLLGDKGASNVWAVDGAHTAHGHAVVAHDPHLSHRGPGVFYLVHLEGPDFTIAGGTFPGIPAVLIGHGDHVAWGIPVSNVDSQDLVRITPYAGNEDYYWLDGTIQPFGLVTQRYRLGSGPDADVVEEQWRTTVFGPVLPPGYDYLHDGETYALMWTGFDPMGTSADTVHSFWQLARAENIEDASAALQLFTAPPMSLGLAFSDGTIAYRLSGDVPLRRSGEPLGFPRDGRTRDAGWRGRLSPEAKPQLQNPARGYLVAANQRVVDDEGPQARYLGMEGATPHRAERIHQRLQALLEGGHLATTEEILAIQQDIESVEARALAGPLGAACPDAVEGHPAERVRGFCEAIRGFDGRFSTESLGALPYTWLWDATRREILRAHLGDDVADQAFGMPHVQMALEAAARSDGPDAPHPLLDDAASSGHEGLAPFVAKAARTVLDELVARAGAAPQDWRWGKMHTLAVRSPLATAPVLGTLFQTMEREEAGCRPCIRSERGTPVTHGAALRLIGEMDPAGVQVRLVSDSGASGHFGHRHLDDQVPLWQAGNPLRLALPRAEVEATRAGWLRVLPAP